MGICTPMHNNSRGKCARYWPRGHVGDTPPWKHDPWKTIPKMDISAWEKIHSQDSTQSTLVTKHHPEKFPQRNALSIRANGPLVLMKICDMAVERTQLTWSLKLPYILVQMKIYTRIYSVCSKFFYSFVRSFIHSFTKNWFRLHNVKTTARTPNSVKQKDRIHGTERKQFVICRGSCRDSLWQKVVSWAGSSTGDHAFVVMAASVSNKLPLSDPPHCYLFLEADWKLVCSITLIMSYCVKWSKFLELDWIEQGLTSHSTHFRSFLRQWGDSGISQDCSRSQSPQCVRCWVVCARPLLITVVYCVCVLFERHCVRMF